MANEHRTPGRAKLVFLAGSSGEAIRRLIAAVSDPSDWQAVCREPESEHLDRYTFELVAVASLAGVMANAMAVALVWLLVS